LENDLPPLAALVDIQIKNRGIPIHVWEFTHHILGEFEWMKVPPVETKDFERMIPGRKRNYVVRDHKPVLAWKSTSLGSLDRRQLDLINLTLSVWQYLVIRAAFDICQITESQLEEWSGIPRENFRVPLIFIRRYCDEHYLPALDSMLIEDFDGIRITAGAEARMLCRTKWFQWFSIPHPDRSDFVPYLEGLKDL